MPRSQLQALGQNSGTKVLLFAYSEVGFRGLEFLLKHAVQVVGLFTHEDDPAETSWFHSVGELAQSAGIPVFRPVSLRSQQWENVIDELAPDLILSLYYRNMIPMSLLRKARLGAYNMHGSLLPRYRGRAPLNWAMIHGEDHTGVTLHVMEKSADTGAIVDQEKIPIGPRESVANVLPRVPAAAVRVLSRQIDHLLQGSATLHPQDESKATYFGRRTAADGRIDWNQSGARIFNLVRAVTRPFPGAFSEVEGGGKLTVWWGEKTAQKSDAAAGSVLSLEPLTVRTGDGVFRITDSESSANLSLAVGMRLMH